MAKLTIVVKQGDVHINSVRVLRATPDVIWLNADTQWKGAVVDCLGTDTEVVRGRTYKTMRAYISRGEYREDATVSSFAISGLGEDWTLAGTSVGRYSVQMVLVRENRRRREGIRLADWFDVQTCCMQPSV
jgi:hypothetical protein